MANTCKYANCHRKTRKRSVACSFSYFSDERLFWYNLSIPLTIPSILENLPTPITLGDHLRRRRLELGLHQKDVAKIIGVTTSSIWNWEHGAEPELRYQPQIITFLGYVPFDGPADTMERLDWYKRIHGMTLDDLGSLSGRHHPLKKNQMKIEEFLLGQNDFLCAKKKS